MDAAGSGAAGAAGAAGEAGTMAAGGSGGQAGTGPAPGGAVDPIIPEVMGECPQFAAGRNTVTVLGIPATVIAGDEMNGTGSLLFYFYGTGGLGTVDTMLPLSVQTQITAEGGIVFAPQSAMNTGGDCSGTNTFGIDDFKIVDQVTACAVENYGIDPRRIYATGCSAGGLTTGCLGIMRSNYIAAVAPNSGGVTIGYGPLQNPDHMPDAITMNGGVDDNVFVNFGETSEAYDNYVLTHGGFAVDCIHTFGHCGASAGLYESAWQFLKDHPFGTPKPDPYASGLPASFDPTCKVFEMTSRVPFGGF